MKPMIKTLILMIILAGIFLYACSPADNIEPTVLPSAQVTGVRSAVPTGTALPTLTATFSPTPTLSPSATPSLTPTSTSTLTPVPTYAVLRGKVLVDQAVCHYGPGAPYLYKYAVIRDSNLEIIGRDQRGIYVQIQAIGGNNPCWVKAEYMEIKGNVMDLEPIDPDEAGIPFTPYYGPISSVSAVRDGNDVTVFWSPVYLKAGDDSEQVPYVVEAWICQGGELLFTPMGAWETTLTLSDEPGCSEPSRGRVYAAEKHGYTRPVEIPWPQASDTPTPSPQPVIDNTATPEFSST